MPEERPLRKRPGGRKGHQGVTRPKPEPQKTVVVTREECLNCGSELEEPNSIETRVIEDIRKPQTLTEYKVGHYFCKTSEKEVKQPAIPTFLQRKT